MAYVRKVTTMRKTAVFATLILALVFPLPMSAAAQTTERASCPSWTPRAGYVDVTPGSTHAFDIDCIWWLSITDREGVFAPTEFLPRWEMGQWMDQALLWVLSRPDSLAITFTDTGSLSDPIQQSIEAIRLLGVTKGIGGGLYDPYGAVPRWQMALFLTRMIHASGVTLPAGGDQGFTDIGATAPEAVKAINQLAEIGVTRGTSPTTFSPDEAVTREQMASFVARAIEHSWRLAFMPMSDTCDLAAITISCTDSYTLWTQPRDVAIRFLYFAPPGSDLDRFERDVHGPGSRIEVTLDGVPQTMTMTYRRFEETAYAFWEMILPAGTSGSHELVANYFDLGAPQLTYQVTVDFQ